MQRLEERVEKEKIRRSQRRHIAIVAIGQVIEYLERRIIREKIDMAIGERDHRTTWMRRFQRLIATQKF